MSPQTEPRENPLIKALRSLGIQNYDAHDVISNFERRLFKLGASEREDLVSAIVLDLLEAKKRGVNIQTHDITKAIDKLYKQIVRKCYGRAQLTLEPVSRENVEEEVRLRELEEIVRSLVRTLKGDESIILALKFFGDSDKDIQRKLDISPATFIRKVHRIKGRIDHLIGDKNT